jgi:outer membrane protein TolC
MVGFRVSVPLPVWNDNAGRIREATAAAARAEREADSALLNATSETASARHAMAVYLKIYTELDASALPQATHLEELVKASHLAGQAPLNEVLRTRSRRLELQKQKLDVLRDYHLARIRCSSAAVQPSTSK